MNEFLINQHCFKSSPIICRVQYGKMGKNNQYNIVYCTVNLINGKFYIGVFSTAKDYIKHKYIGSGNGIKNAIKKYGKENFFRLDLEFYNNEEIIYDREAEIINTKFLIKYKNDCYNIAKGGSGGWSVIHNSPNYNKIKEKCGKTISKIHKERYKNMSKEEYKKLCERQKEINNRSEVKEKQKIAREKFLNSMTEEEKIKYYKNNGQGYKIYVQNMTKEEYEKLCKLKRKSYTNEMKLEASQRQTEICKNRSEEEKQLINNKKKESANKPEVKEKQRQNLINRHKNETQQQKDQIAKLCKEANLDTCFVNNGIQNKRLKKKIAEQYIINNKDWKYGMKPRKKII